MKKLLPKWRLNIFSRQWANDWQLLVLNVDNVENNMKKVKCFCGNCSGKRSRIDFTYKKYWSFDSPSFFFVKHQRQLRN